MEEENKIDSQKNGDPFSELMFGSRRRVEEVDEQPVNSSNLDYEKLMEHIGNLMDSVNNLKPAFQKVIPIVQQLWKKE